MKFEKRIGVNQNFFDEPNLLNYYWAGFIAADGCVRGHPRNQLRIKLQFRDRNHLSQFSHDCLFEGGVKDTPDKTQSYVEICGVKNWVCTLKENFNIIPNKTHVLEPPNLVVLEHMWSYIIGLIDGDGSIYFEIDRSLKPRIRLSFNGTESVLVWVRTLFDSYFPQRKKRYNPSQVLKRPGTKTTYNYRLSGERAIESLSFLSNFDVPKLYRKWSKVRPLGV